MKKRVSLWILTMFAAIAMAAAFSGKVKAAELKPVEASPAGITSQFKAVSTVTPSTPAKSSFGVLDYRVNPLQALIWYTNPSGSVSLQFQVYKNNSLIKSGYFNGLEPGEQFYGSEPLSFVRNAVYKYRIRGINSYGEYGNWSAFRYICVPSIKSKAKSNKKGFTVTTPKNKRVKKYFVYVSKTLNGTYKKTKSISANKKRTTRITKNYRKRYVNYFKVFPYVKVGKKVVRSDIPYHGKIGVFK